MTKTTTSSNKIVEFRRRRKQFLVDLLNSECHRCGYNECNAALQFHHADPDKKLFSLGATGNTSSIEIQTEEILKCWLLCSNCHKQIDFCADENDDIYHSHEAVIEFHKSNDTITKAGLEIKKVQADRIKGLTGEGRGAKKRNETSLAKIIVLCKNEDCDTRLNNKNRSVDKTGFCGPCYRISIARIKWGCSCVLKGKLETMTYTALARELGVSDNGIRRRLKAHPDCIC